MMTYSGKYFWFEDIQDNDADIQDIAHALSNLCRFGGHTREFYSVAQHSVLVSHLAPPQYALDALLHDATEAYVQDLISPIKRQLRDYVNLEEKVMHLIHDTFKVNTQHPLIKVADMRALYAEANHFYKNVAEWEIDKFECDCRITPLSPKQAKAMFLKRYEELSNNVTS